MIQAGPSSWDRRDDVKGNRDSNRLQAIQLGFVPENATTRPIRHQHLAIGDLERLLQDRVGPIHVFNPMCRRRRARSCALTTGIRCEDISIPYAAAMPAACIQPVAPPIRATSGMTKSLALRTNDRRSSSPESTIKAG
jgi:hypothetical protein